MLAGVPPAGQRSRASLCQQTNTVWSEATCMPVHTLLGSFSGTASSPLTDPIVVVVADLEGISFCDMLDLAFVRFNGVNEMAR